MIQLTNKIGETIPQVGLGTFPFEGRVMADMVKAAINVGYRLFDTADDYRGEPGIGLAVKELSAEGFNREQLFLQTKISDNNAHENEPLKGIYFNPTSRFMQRHTVDEIVREKVANSLRDMKTDYIIDIWKTMINLKEEGVVRYIGVSNFHERHIDKLIAETGVTPDINEVYVSPIGIKQCLVEYCNNRQILVMPYSPLMDVAYGKISTEKLLPIMDKYKKSLAQVVLRWNLERGCFPLPKTKNPKRLEENFNVFDFSLTPEEVEIISSLNYDNQYLVESKICPGL